MGLPAIGISRLLQNACFAAGDTRGPARIAAFRVAVSAVVGITVMFPLDRVVIGPDGLVALSGAWTSFNPLDAAQRAAEGPVRLGAIGLALGSAVGAWVELTMLSLLVRRRVPGLRDPKQSLLKPAVAGAVTFVLVAFLKLFTTPLPLLIEAPLVVGVAAFGYAILCFRAGVSDAALLLKPIRRVIWHRRR